MSIVWNASGTDVERASYTSSFIPNPTRIQGGSGVLTTYGEISGGSGDISANYTEYLNRDGVSPNGGQGAL